MEYIEIGKIYTTHGLNGEIKVKSNFKYKDQIYIDKMKFYFGDSKEEYLFLSCRKQNDFDLLLFYDLDSIDKVIKYRGVKIYIKRNELVLSNEKYLDSDLLGFICYYNNKVIGKVLAITDMGSGNFVIEINNNDKTIYIPQNKRFIKKIDLDTSIIELINVEGLL